MPNAGARRRAHVHASAQRDDWYFDPMSVLPHIEMPVLAITGEKDLHVYPEDLDLISEAVAGPQTPAVSAI